MTRPEAELSFSNSMGKLDTRQGNVRSPKRFEAGHWSTSPFDRSVVLLNEIVEIARAPHLDILPSRILPSQKT